MAIELITGRYGTAHIGSEDVRAYQAYTAGSGRYVLHGGGASIQSANDVHLNPAEILIDGAHVRITGQGEDVTLENGASSYNRVDIVALHYLMTGSGDAAVESVTLEVVKGTPSELTPSDPEMPASGSILDNVSETYVPYVRVLIQGLTPQTPEMLLPSYVNPADISGDGDQVDPSVLVNLGSTSADTIFKAEPRPGVYGTLPASRGGTGQTSLQAARNAMGLGNTTGALPVANGGTGATSADRARANLKAASYQGDLTNGYFTSNNAAGHYLQIVGNNSNGKTRTITVSDEGIGLWKSDEDEGAGTIPWSSKSRAREAYPVGAVYISYKSTSPASLFGGTWTPITGRFPYFNAGTGTGGSNTHTLSVNEMPSHRHGIAIKGSWTESSGAGLWNPGNVFSGRGVINNGAAGEWGNAVEQTLMANKGGGAAHNNMPAYQTLYAWRRTA